MKGPLRRALAGLGGAVVAVAATGLSPVYATTTTCSGGSIAGGSYGDLTVTGLCTVDAGSVSVANLTIAPGGWLIAAFGNAAGTVDHLSANNVTIGMGSVLIAGCEPEAFPCFNDPNANTAPTYSTIFAFAGYLTASGANAVILHNGSVISNVAITGGGGGKACNFVSGPLMGNPFYDDVEDTSIGGNLTIRGVNTCWIGVFRDTISQNVTFYSNVDPNAISFFTGLPDGNEIATNWIGGNLSCKLNNPTPQFGDSGGSPDTVMGFASGQCWNLVFS